MVYFYLDTHFIKAVVINIISVKENKTAHYTSFLPYLFTEYNYRFCLSIKSL